MLIEELGAASQVALSWQGGQRSVSLIASFVAVGATPGRELGGRGADNLCFVEPVPRSAGSCPAPPLRAQKENPA